ncbi:hypothetical protein N7462_008608 [Penicillium macrosclerotiorum]|uniref:uncharacterized protein n=1 Tax=Penicillium macrosclerotiorum TaxID=303699 RepID=UPI002548C7FA|nr:uncharacterized protein N7462_008608 [Penicillium macrosclerotiorum]KAJ5675711.1 hypothetical protein N7462_008608 [Penicillium macrosclerotiorum]
MLTRRERPVTDYERWLRDQDAGYQPGPAAVFGPGPDAHGQSILQQSEDNARGGEDKERSRSRYGSIFYPNERPHAVHPTAALISSAGGGCVVSCYSAASLVAVLAVGMLIRRVRVKRRVRRGLGLDEKIMDMEKRVLE